MTARFKSRLVLLALLIVSPTSVVSGQTLFPTPEHQKMDYFAGDWKLQGTMKLSPTVPGGDFTSTEHSEWVSGNFFLQTHSSMHSVMGDVRGVRVMEYNADDKVYTYNAYNSLGEHQMAIGHILDNIWTWTSEAKMNGVLAKGRYTITVVSPVVYTFKYETLTQAGAWATVMEGKATRNP
ncbi:MAG: DUF1579 family protein [Terriglobales bacterium]|jgi:hypothetical protein